MAEKHDDMVSRFRARLVSEGYRIETRSPFADYRPDISASRGRRRVFVEIEISSTLETDHTLHQLERLHSYASRNSGVSGILVVPPSDNARSQFMLDSIFGDNVIRVETIGN
jgi:Holliday junction resolvase